MLDGERRAITEEWRRIAVAIPRLSNAAEDALMRLTVEVKNNGRLQPGRRDVDLTDVHEGQAVNAAERFCEGTANSRTLYNRSDHPVAFPNRVLGILWNATKVASC
ncbi:hypothetical protein [Rhizobium hidalgonense]|uniref:hypothetical protein n=1 Tax=Rhizobium hidalgonense TaxID=1538159 RepID=UPI0035C760F6